MSGGSADAPYATEIGPEGTRFTEVRHFAELDSTNRYLSDVARAAPRPGLVAVADHQTAGRGRLGRRWEAPGGANLLVSVLLCPEMAVTDLHLCTIAVGLAAAEACCRGAGVAPTLKWPNDLMVGERKLGGILAESVPQGELAGRALVVGLGLNVGWPPAGEDGTPAEEESSSAPLSAALALVPDDLRRSATSIVRETGSVVAPRALLDLLLVGLEDRLVALDDPERRPDLVQEYRERCSTLGRKVRVIQSQGELVGTAVEITADGHLVVDSGAGTYAITAGDVVHVRPGH